MKCSKCQRNFDEYYEVKTNVPNGSTVILCYDCWRRIDDEYRQTGLRIKEQLDKLIHEENVLNKQKEEYKFGSFEWKLAKERLEQIDRERERIYHSRPYYNMRSAIYHSEKSSSPNNVFINQPVIQTQIPTTPTPSSHNMSQEQTPTTIQSEQNAADIKSCFPDVAVYKQKDSSALFQGRNLPSFVKDYIIRRYSDAEGNVDTARLKEYLEAKMPTDNDTIKNRLLRGERINLTTRAVFETLIGGGKVKFELPDIGIISDSFVSGTLIENAKDTIFDGEQWGNMTIMYIAPEKKQKGYISMVEFKPFEPYKIDLEYYRQARRKFSLEEWIDTLVMIIGYTPDKLKNEGTKLEYISRLLSFVEPFLNMIELGPKSTGKSHLYNNFSKRGWCISGGKISRAKLFYHKQTHKFGLLKHYDVISIDEISTFSFENPDEMQSAFKAYLEAGKCTLDSTMFLSECGLVLMGNIQLDENHQPIDAAHYKALPEMLRESATLDRFHAFIEGWKLPRLEVGLIHQGWTLDSEYFSSIMHSLRSEGEYATIFDDIVTYDATADLRDLKAVKKVATAYTKLLFPHVRSTQQLTPDALERFKETYNKYCLQPAISRRVIIRQQCHLIDREFTADMPEIKIK